MKIVLSAVLALFLVGCSEDSSKEVQSAEPKQAVTQEVKSEAPKAEVAKVVEDAAKEAEVVVEEVKEDVKAAAVTAVAEVKKEVEKVAEVTKVVTEEAAAKVAEVKTEVVAAVATNGETVYKACASCHGANAEKAALGKSQVIKGWSADKVASALNGYKDGSYGGVMKGIMKGQAAKLTPEDTKAVSEYISKL